MIKYVKTILAIILLGCLFDMPYGYYQLVGFISMVAFGYFAYVAYKQRDAKKAVAYLVLLILFQPLIKVALGRTIWNIVDVIVAIALLIDVVTKKPKTLNNAQKKMSHHKNKVFMQKTKQETRKIIKQ